MVINITSTNKLIIFIFIIISSSNIETFIAIYFMTQKCGIFFKSLLLLLLKEGNKQTNHVLIFLKSLSLIIIIIYIYIYIYIFK